MHDQFTCRSEILSSDGDSTSTAPAYKELARLWGGGGAGGGGGGGGGVEG